MPFLTGTTATEVTFFANAQVDPIDDATFRTRVKELLRVNDAQADTVIAVYRKNRPKSDNIDLFLRMSTDASFFRQGVDTQAERKAAAGNAPVYVYRYEWYSPVRDGKLKSYHTLEIPFVFDNVDGAPTMTRDRRGSLRAGRQDEPRVGRFREDRQSEPSRPARLASVQRHASARPWSSTTNARW